MTVQVDPGALREAARGMDRCDEMLLGAGLAARGGLDLACAGAGHPGVHAAAADLATRLAELFARLSLAHDTGSAGLLAAAASYAANDARACSDTALLSASFGTALAGWAS